MTFDQWYELQNKGHSDEQKADMRAAWEAAHLDGYIEGHNDGITWANENDQ